MSRSAWAWVLVLCLAQIVSTMDRGMLAPCAVTIISDAFPAAARGRPMAV